MFFFFCIVIHIVKYFGILNLHSQKLAKIFYKIIVKYFIKLYSRYVFVSLFFGLKSGTNRVNKHTSNSP